MIPDIKGRSAKTVGLFCDSLFWDYSQIEEGKDYTYDQLISLIKDDGGTVLPKRTKVDSKEIQFEAWGITLDLEEIGEHAHKSYLVKKKRNFDINTKIDISNELAQDFLLSRDNKSGLIYNIVLFLLKIRGRKAWRRGEPVSMMEFSKGKWEVEVGMVSRVFQKMLFNGDNILTQSILGNILKLSVDEVKKNIFLRALEFMGNDPDINCQVKTKVLFIDADEGVDTDLSDTEALAAHKIKYQGKVYDYKSAYANDLLLEMIGVIEDQVLSEMKFDSQREVVAAGKYPEYRTAVARRISNLEVSKFFITGDKELKNKENLGGGKESEGTEGKRNYKILNYWKVYEISIPDESLNKRITKIIAKNNNIQKFESEEDILNDQALLADYLTMLKKELNEYVEVRVGTKVNLADFDFTSSEGEKLAEELSWISYFSKYAQYRIYSPREWDSFLLGNDEEIVEKDGVKFIFDKDGAISGMIDDTYSRINFMTGEIDRDGADDFAIFSALERLAAQIINENKSLIEIKDKYTKKMGDLVQSIILSKQGEISEKGLDLDAMNDKIKELMQTQFKPRKDALRIARKIMYTKKKA